MTVCKLEIKSTIEIRDKIKIDAWYDDNDNQWNEKWVSVESLQQWLPFLIDSYLTSRIDAVSHTLESFIRSRNDGEKVGLLIQTRWAKKMVEAAIKDGLGLLEQKEPFSIKASPKKQEEQKP